MTRRLALSAQQLLAPVDLGDASPRRIGTLVAHEGIMLGMVLWDHALAFPVWRGI